ncbi:hypothetical protein ACFWZ2_09370 [Streptomyces sp. NPDC059002]|uniref:hypothetical protein n=1 Tax=unclassified Streptomyces TaxID=2593676 RepID=UPI0036B5772F
MAARTPHRAPLDLSEEESRQATLARLAARRERLGGRSMAVRVLAAGAGAVMGLGGLLLMVLLPELGIPLLLGGLSLLALEFDWASRAVVRVEWWTVLLRRWLARQSPTVRALLVLAVIAVAVLIIWLIL